MDFISTDVTTVTNTDASTTGTDLQSRGTEAKKRKITKEDKARKKEEKRLAKLKEREDYLLQIKKDQIDREIKFTKEQISEIRRKVFETAQILNYPIIREEFLHKWGYFERTVDLKDYYISQLKEDIFYYEMQHRILEQMHMENINKLIDIYEDQVDRMKEIYVKERNLLIKKRLAQQKRLIMTQNRRIEYIESLMINVTEGREQEFKEISYEQIQETQQQLGGFTVANENIAITGDRQIEKVWSELKPIFDRYKVLTQQKRFEYLILKDKDSRERIEIDYLNNRIIELHYQIKEYKNQLTKVTDTTKIIEDLNVEKQKYLSVYNSMRNNLKRDEDMDLRQITFLSNTSSHVIKQLESVLNKMKEIFRLLDLCIKENTIEEVVAPRLDVEPPLHIFKKDKLLNMMDDFEQLWGKCVRLQVANKHMNEVFKKYKQERKILILKLKDVLLHFSERM